MNKASKATKSASMTKRVPTISHVELCADEVTNTRDFCGNESDAINDFCAEHNIFNSSVFVDCVIGTVNKRWRESQQAAGVKVHHLV